MNGRKAKQLRQEFPDKMMYRKAKGRPQYHVGLNKPYYNIMQVPVGLDEKGNTRYAEVPRWIYKSAENYSYESRQPKRYTNRSKY